MDKRRPRRLARGHEGTRTKEREEHLPVGPRAIVALVPIVSRWRAATRRSSFVPIRRVWLTVSARRRGVLFFAVVTTRRGVFVPRRPTHWRRPRRVGPATCVVIPGRRRPLVIATRAVAPWRRAAAPVVGVIRRRAIGTATRGRSRATAIATTTAVGRRGLRLFLRPN